MDRIFSIRPINYLDSVLFDVGELRQHLFYDSKI